jgi:hypothetical protein
MSAMRLAKSVRVMAYTIGRGGDVVKRAGNARGMKVLAGPMLVYE